MKPLDLAAWCAALFLAANLFPHTVALRLTLLVLGLMFAGFAVARAKRPLDLKLLPPLLIPILLWAAWAALSITWSIDPERSMKEYKNEVVYVFLGYWLCWVAAQAPGARRTFGIALGIGAALACAIGIYGYLAPAVPASLDRFASGPGDQSSALLTLMPLVLMAIWLARAENASRSLRVALWSLPPAFLAAAYATLNRTVWLGFAIELIVMAALLLPRPELAWLRNRTHARTLTAMLAVALVGGLGVAMLQVQEKRFGDNLDAAATQDPRLKVWAVAIETIKEHPIKGLGFGRGIDRQTLHEEFGNPLLWHAHNLILEAAVETGIVGGALLLLLIGSTAYKGLRLSREQSAAHAACGVALVAIVVGMFARNMTDTLLVRQNALLYWGVAGLLLALGAGASRRN